jgi:hypothetical protein
VIRETVPSPLNLTRGDGSGGQHANPVLVEASISGHDRKLAGESPSYTHVVEGVNDCFPSFIDVDQFYGQTQSSHKGKSKPNIR